MPKPTPIKIEAGTVLNISGFFIGAQMVSYTSTHSLRIVCVFAASFKFHPPAGKVANRLHYPARPRPAPPDLILMNLLVLQLGETYFVHFIVSLVFGWGYIRQRTSH